MKWTHAVITAGNPSRVEEARLVRKLNSDLQVIALCQNANDAEIVCSALQNSERDEDRKYAVLVLDAAMNVPVFVR